MTMIKEDANVQLGDSLRGGDAPIIHSQDYIISIIMEKNHHNSVHFLYKVVKWRIKLFLINTNIIDDMPAFLKVKWINH